MIDIANRSGNEASRRHLDEVRVTLLHLHKLLLEIERGAYERAHGRVASSGEMLRLVIEHEQFGWLHAISELIVRFDEMLDAKEEMTAPAAKLLLLETRTLLRASETGTVFERKYDAVLQADPDVIFAHREVMEAVSKGLSDLDEG